MSATQTFCVSASTAGSGCDRPVAETGRASVLYRGSAQSSGLQPCRQPGLDQEGCELLSAIHLNVTERVYAYAREAR